MRSPGPNPGEPLRRQYSFGDFTLDVEHRALRRGGEEIALRRKSFDVLAYLVDRHGELVTKAVLMGAVWPDTAVTDNSLTQCMVEIRRALDDDAQQLIRTVARRGYVFEAPVTTSIVEFPRQPAAGSAEPRAFEISGLDTTRDRGQAAVAAIELMRKSRLFIRSLNSGSGSSSVYIQGSFGRRMLQREDQLERR